MAERDDAIVEAAKKQAAMDPELPQTYAKYAETQSWFKRKPQEPRPEWDTMMELETKVWDYAMKRERKRLKIDKEIKNRSSQQSIVSIKDRAKRLKLKNESMELLKRMGIDPIPIGPKDEDYIAFLTQYERDYGNVAEIVTDNGGLTKSSVKGWKREFVNQTSLRLLRAGLWLNLKVLMPELKKIDEEGMETDCKPNRTYEFRQWLYYGVPKPDDRFLKTYGGSKKNPCMSCYRNEPCDVCGKLPLQEKKEGEGDNMDGIVYYTGTWRFACSSDNIAGGAGLHMCSACRRRYLTAGNREIALKDAKPQESDGQDNEIIDNSKMFDWGRKFDTKAYGRTIWQRCEENVVNEVNIEFYISIYNGIKPRVRLTEGEQAQANKPENRIEVQWPVGKAKRTDEVVLMWFTRTFTVHEVKNQNLQIAVNDSTTWKDYFNAVKKYANKNKELKSIRDSEDKFQKTVLRTEDGRLWLMQRKIRGKDSKGNATYHTIFLRYVQYRQQYRVDPTSSTSDVKETNSDQPEGTLMVPKNNITLGKANNSGSGGGAQKGELDPFKLKKGEWAGKNLQVKFDLSNGEKQYKLYCGETLVNSTSMTKKTEAEKQAKQEAKAKRQAENAKRKAQKQKTQEEKAAAAAKKAKAEAARLEAQKFIETMVELYQADFKNHVKGMRTETWEDDLKKDTEQFKARLIFHTTGVLGNDIDAIKTAIRDTKPTTIFKENATTVNKEGLRVQPLIDEVSASPDHVELVTFYLTLEDYFGNEEPDRKVNCLEQGIPPDKFPLELKTQYEYWWAGIRDYGPLKELQENKRKKAQAQAARAARANKSAVRGLLLGHRPKPNPNKTNGGGGSSSGAGSSSSSAGSSGGGGIKRKTMGMRFMLRSIK